MNRLLFWGAGVALTMLPSGASASLIVGGGTVATAFSAKFAPVPVTVPEPRTWIELALGLGLVAITAYGRRSRKNDS